MGTSPHPLATPEALQETHRRTRNARPKPKPQRPPKPYPDFPLAPHLKGYWYKKIAGRQVPFGKWAWPVPEAYERSWKLALDAYHQHLEDAAHGRLLVSRPEEMAIGDLVDAFLTHQQGRARGKVQEIKSATFAEKRRVVRDFRDFVGAAATVGQLEHCDPTRPQDCLVLRWIERQRESYGWHRFNTHMGILSGMWTWAEHPIRGVLGRPFRLKVFFERLEERLRLREKEKRTEALGKQRWSADELQAFFTFAPMPLRAMLKLEYFAGYGNSDCSDLYQAAVNAAPDKELGLPEGWGIIHFPRGKTQIERSAVIPKTAMDDLQAAMAARPAPEDPRWANRVFLTRFGRPWVRDAVHADEEDPEMIGRVVSDDPLGKEFAKLRNRLSRCKVHGWFAAGRTKGKGFRSDRKEDPKLRVRAERRPKALTKCPACGKPMTPMRRLGAYTFRHTAITDASGVAHIDTLCLFEGRAIEGSRRFYVEEVEAHKLLPIAVRLLNKAGLAGEIPESLRGLVAAQNAVIQSASLPPAGAAPAAPGAPAPAAGAGAAPGAKATPATTS
jgi:hypothetical protein